MSGMLTCVCCCHKTLDQSCFRVCCWYGLRLRSLPYMDNHTSVTDAAQRLARRSPDAAGVFLDLKLDSDDSRLDMAAKEPTSNTTSGDRYQPPVQPPRAMSAKQKRKAAARKRLATMQQEK